MGRAPTVCLLMLVLVGLVGAHPHSHPLVPDQSMEERPDETKSEDDAPEAEGGNPTPTEEDQPGGSDDAAAAPATNPADDSEGADAKPAEPAESDSNDNDPTEEAEDEADGAEVPDSSESTAGGSDKETADDAVEEKDETAAAAENDSGDAAGSAEQDQPEGAVAATTDDSPEKESAADEVVVDDPAATGSNGGSDNGAAPEDKPADGAEAVPPADDASSDKETAETPPADDASSDKETAESGDEAAPPADDASSDKETAESGETAAGASAPGQDGFAQKFIAKFNVDKLWVVMRGAQLPVTVVEGAGGKGKECTMIDMISKEKVIVAAGGVIPSTTATGTWMINCGGNAGEDDVKAFVVFNALDKDGGINMDEPSCQEYLLNEDGIVFKAESPHHWQFDQFSSATLETLVLLMDRTQLASKIRKSPVLMSRWLTGVINHEGNEEEGERGVLVGRWDGDYTGGQKPGFWTSSSQIFRRFLEKGGEPVSYGQCWVFSGLLTSALRAVGVPVRPVTNLDSGHDTGEKVHANSETKAYTGCIDEFYKKDADGVLVKDKALITDSVWNYHVWNEAYMERPDLDPPMPAGWQAVDATPQELSRKSKKYECGPASVGYIKSVVESGTDITTENWKQQCKDYETCFIVGEVAADRCKWAPIEGDEAGCAEPHSEYKNYCLFERIKGSTGTKVLTKSPGDRTDEAQDVRSEYGTTNTNSSSTVDAEEEEEDDDDVVTPVRFEMAVGRAAEEGGRKEGCIHVNVGPCWSHEHALKKIPEWLGQQSEYQGVYTWDGTWWSENGMSFARLRPMNMDKCTTSVFVATNDASKSGVTLGQPIVVSVTSTNDAQNDLEVDINVEVTASTYTRITTTALVPRAIRQSMTLNAGASQVHTIVIAPATYLPSMAFTDAVTFTLTAYVREAAGLAPDQNSSQALASWSEGTEAGDDTKAAKEGGDDAKKAMEGGEEANEAKEGGEDAKLEESLVGSGCCSDVSVHGLEETYQGYRMGRYRALPQLHRGRILYKQTGNEQNYVYHLNQGGRWLIGDKVDMDEAGIAANGEFCPRQLQPSVPLSVSWYDGIEWKAGKVKVTCLTPFVSRQVTLDGSLTYKEFEAMFVTADQSRGLADTPKTVSRRAAVTLSAFAARMGCTEADAKALFSTPFMEVYEDGSVAAKELARVLDRDRDGRVSIEDVAHALYVTPSRITKMQSFITSHGGGAPRADESDESVEDDGDGSGAAAAAGGESGGSVYNTELRVWGRGKGKMVQTVVKDLDVKLDTSDVLRASPSEEVAGNTTIKVEVYNPLNVSLTKVQIQCDAETVTICGKKKDKEVCVGGYEDHISDLADIKPGDTGTLELVAVRETGARHGVAIVLDSKELDASAKTVWVGVGATETVVDQTTPQANQTSTEEPSTAPPVAALADAGTTAETAADDDGDVVDQMAVETSASSGSDGPQEDENDQDEEAENA